MHASAQRLPTTVTVTQSGELLVGPFGQRRVNDSVLYRSRWHTNMRPILVKYVVLSSSPRHQDGRSVHRNLIRSRDVLSTALRRGELKITSPSVRRVNISAKGSCSASESGLRSPSFEQRSPRYRNEVFVCCATVPQVLSPTRTSSPSMHTCSSR